VHAPGTDNNKSKANASIQERHCGYGRDTSTQIAHNLACANWHKSSRFKQLGECKCSCNFTVPTASEFANMAYNRRTVPVLHSFSFVFEQKCAYAHICVKYVPRGVCRWTQEMDLIWGGDDKKNLCTTTCSARKQKVIQISHCDNETKPIMS